MKIALNNNQRNRLTNLGLINITTKAKRKRGFRSFLDPITGARYIFSPRGYLLRKSKAGMYQLNPRFFVPGSFTGNKAVQATVRTIDTGALVEMLVKGVKNFRKHNYAI